MWKYGKGTVPIQPKNKYWVEPKNIFCRLLKEEGERVVVDAFSV